MSNTKSQEGQSVKSIGTLRMDEGVDLEDYFFLPKQMPRDLPYQALRLIGLRVRATLMSRDWGDHRA